MGSTIDDFGDPDRNARAEWLARIAHFLPWAAAIVLVHDVLWAFDLFSRWGWIGLVIDVACVLLWLVTIIVCGYHLALGRLCLKCMQAVKEDAPLRVQRPRTRFLLKLDHTIAEMSGWKRLAAILLFFSLPFLLSLIIDDLVVRRWIYMPFDLLVIAWIYSAWPHHKYRPWCPWCRRWDEGGEHEPSPDPVDSGEKVA